MSTTKFHSVSSDRLGGALRSGETLDFAARFVAVAVSATAEDIPLLGWVMFKAARSRLEKCVWETIFDETEAGVRDLLERVAPTRISSSLLSPGYRAGGRGQLAPSYQLRKG